MKLSGLNNSLSLNLNRGPTTVEPSILLHKIIPHVLAYKNPRTFFGQEWWDEVRREVYKSNNWCCQACGDCEHLPLDAHEMFEYEEVTASARAEMKVLRATFTGIVPLCRKCHKYIHFEALSQRKQVRILNRGNKILMEAGLKVPRYKALLSTVTVPAKKMDNFHINAAYYHKYYENWLLDLSRLVVTEEMKEMLKDQEVLECITE